MEPIFIEYSDGVPVSVIVRSNPVKGTTTEVKYGLEYTKIGKSFSISHHHRLMRTIFPDHRYQVRKIVVDKKQCNVFHYTPDCIIIEYGNGVGQPISLGNEVKYVSPEAMENSTFTGFSFLVEEDKEITKEIIANAEKRQEQREFEEEVQRRMAKHLYEQRINAEVQHRLSTLSEDGINKVFEEWKGFPFFKDIASLLKP